MIRRLWRRHAWPWFGVALGLMGTISAYWERGPLQALRRVYFDRLKNYREAVALDGPSSDLVLLAYDDETARRYGIQIPRERLAELVETVVAAGAKVVALDHTFDAPDAPSVAVAQALGEAVSDLTPQAGEILTRIRGRHDATARLVRSLQGNPIVGAFYTSMTARGGQNASFEALPRRWSIQSDGCEGLGPPRGLVLDLASVQNALRWGGDVFLQADDDNVVRRYPLFTRVPRGDCPGCTYPSLAVAAAAAFRDQDLQNDAFIKCDRGLVVYFSMGPDWVPLDADGRIEVDYRGTFSESFPNYIPAWKVLAGEVPPDRLRDKLIFVGQRSELLDYVKTPAEDRFPGVGVHAVVADSLLHNHWLRRGERLQFTIEPAAFLSVGILVTMVFLMFEDAYWPLLLWPAFPLAGHYLSLTFLRHGYLVDAFWPGVIGSVAVLASAGARFYLERAARQNTERELGRFLSPQVVNVALRRPELLLPMRREISVLFSDIRDFTTVAERMEPEALRTFLNEYLSRMTHIVFQHHGTLDKYIGDAMMVLFGAPIESDQHALAACRAALQMIDELGGMQKEWRAKGQPVLEIGVGINTGVVSVGRIGSAGQSGYTAIGDAVNFASRAEGLTKVYGVKILVGERTREAAGEAFVFRDLGPARVKGKRKAVRVHELLGSREASPSPPAWIATFAEGMEAFHGRAWDRAERLFRATVEARGGLDAPSQAFLRWIEGFRTQPPGPDWDGTLERQEK